MGRALVLRADPLVWYKMFTSSDQNGIGSIGFVTCFFFFLFFLFVVLLKTCSKKSWIRLAHHVWE